MNSTIVATRTQEQAETRPEPIRVIRQGQWVILASEAEMTESERRAAFVAMFGIYA